MGSVLNLLPYVVHVTDCKTGKLLFLSKNLSTILGYEQDDILLDSTNAFMQSVEAFSSEYEADKEVYQYTYQIEHKNGSAVTVNTRSMVYRSDVNGNPVELLGLSEDITEKIKIEADKEQINLLLSETEIMMNFGSWVWHVKGDKVIWSDGLYRIFGHDPANRKELELGVSTYYEWVHPDDLEHLLERNEIFLATGEQYDDYEHRIITKDGVVKTLIAQAKVIAYEEDGKTIAKAMGSTSDVTYLKKIQNELENKVFKLDSSNRDLEQFAYVASHDLQEPLRKIVAFGERLKMTLGDDMATKPTLYLDRMLDAAGRMRELINNLLSLSRLTSDQAFEAVDLNAIIKDVLSNMELSIEETGAAITVENLPTTKGLAAQLSQLFNNLLSNAIKFRKGDREPVITIKSENITRLEATDYLINGQSYYKITLTDNGIGFSNEYAEQIFTVFKRLHGRIEYAGTGIGLAICRKVVDNHSGFIYADSKVNEGTTFTIILPKNQPLEGK
ncbi:MAG: PAS domain S-box-containing protein [Spirosomataceae bacterium]|jgi:PAS domain S-box-containing protein